jgi:hypothetical protein
MSQKRFSVAAAVVVSGLIASAASAATVGPGLTTVGGNAYPMFPIFGSGPAYAAVKFQVSSLFVPTSLQVVLTHSNLTSATVNFDVVSDASGAPDLTGAGILASFSLTLSGSATAVTQSPTLTTSPSPTLAPSTNYWLVGRGISGVSAANQNVSWLLFSPDGSSLNTSGTVQYDAGFGTNVGAVPANASPAFVLTGASPIPLPGASLMGGAVLLGLLGRRSAGR